MTALHKFKVHLKSRANPRLWLFLSALRGKVAGFFNSWSGTFALRQLKATRKERIANYFANSRIRKLQLGSGANNLPSWLNSEAFAPSSFTHSLKVADDYIFLDVIQPFPFENNSLDYIFHEHVIEHLNYHQGQFMMSECFRVLKPGGRIRIATPDLEVFLGLYAKDINAEQRHFLDEYVRFNSGVWSSDLTHVKDNRPAFVLNHALRAWGHQFIYDYPTLAEVARNTGFVDITRGTPHVSPDPHLSNLEFRRDVVGIFDALIVEATKPPSLEK